ncbi:hypothetical protein DMA11_01635 [Marinilabiliaceae bacterium JC017]|nr:hypothetical protein DMA11_01635 [Marinilabiliaceae bacterium JC017]
MRWLKDSIESFYKPTEEDFRVAESVIIDAILKDKSGRRYILDVDNVRNYYRQYAFYSAMNGDSMVYVNGLCEILEFPSDSCGIATFKPFEWKNKFMCVEDGGDCYWSIMINKSKRSYYHFSINGI